LENSTLSFALTGVVPAVCDAEAGERRRSNTLSPDEEEAIIAVPTFDGWLKRSSAMRPSGRSAASAGSPAARET
jgi:hypothetical protein